MVSSVPHFTPEEQAASYDRWFRAKVQAALDDPRPSVPHDEAMDRIRAAVNLRTTVMENERNDHQT